MFIPEKKGIGTLVNMSIEPNLTARMEIVPPPKQQPKDIDPAQDDCLAGDSRQDQR